MNQKILSKLSSLLFLCSVATAHAVEMKNVQCWKGYSNDQQQSGLQQCNQQLQDLQICSSNLYETQQGAFDVCLMAPVSNPTKTDFVFKGYNQADQDQNLATCNQQRKFGQLCVANGWIDGAGFYDVVLME
jgi:hypothetical protein